MVPEPYEAEFTEKRSRFIGAVAPVRTEEEAAAFIAGRRARFWDATHNCYAYLLREGRLQRYSDDGEPQGTAGVPILEVLRREEVWDAAVVVTRYFGGTLLGAGGLVRAYSRGAALALHGARIAEMRLCTLFRLAYGYPLHDRVALVLQKHGAQVLTTDYAEAVTMTGRVASEGLAALEKELTHLSGGQVLPEPLGEEFAPSPGGM